MKIKIERFKNISSVEFPVKGIVLLVGGNNAGKSSVLQAIQFGISVAQTSKMQSGQWKSDRLSTSIGQNDLVYSPIREVSSLASNGKLKESSSDAITMAYENEEEKCVVTIKKGRNKNIQLILDGKNLGSKLQSIDNPYCALVTGLAGIPSEEESETIFVLRKAAARGNSNSVFRNILLELKKDANKWKIFKRQIERIFPNYVIDVNFNPATDEYINCTVAKSGALFPIDTCGTGVLQAVQIFSYINLFNPKILLLDEPDSHLHPNNQKALAKELLDASEKGLNIIISSHSKHLVEALIDNAELVWLRNGKIEPSVADYELRALMEIGALNVGEAIGNPKYVFLTEDRNSSLLKTLLDVNGFQKNEYDIVPYNGATQIGTAKVLLKELRKRAPHAKYMIHRDRDFMDETEIQKYLNAFAGSNVAVFLPDGNDLEAYFIKPEHIGNVCALAENVVQEILSTAFISRKDELLKKYVNSRIENMRKAGSQVDAGDVSVQAQHLLLGPQSLAVHGKILLSGIRDELQSRGIQDKITNTSSEHLVVNTLINFRSDNSTTSIQAQS